jgi:hypothetical protein
LILDNKNNPVAFQTLILPSMEVIGLETLRKVCEFYKAGGTVVVIGYLPRGAAEKGKDAEVLALLEEIFGKEALEKSQKNRQVKPFSVEASTEWAPGGHSPQLAFDGNPDSRWNSVDKSENGQWLKVVFPEPVEIASVIICEPFDRVAKMQIQAFDAEKNDWITQTTTGPINRQLKVTFPAIKTKELRFLFDHPGQDSISISEINLFDATDQSVLHGSATLTANTSSSGGIGYMAHINPTLSLTRALPLRDDMMKDGDVRFANEDSLPAGSPTGAFMYLHRVIHSRDVYFFTNSTSESIETTVLLRGTFRPRRFEWWNPHTGSRTAVEGTVQSDGKTAIPLKLGPVKSMFLVGTKESEQ